MRKLYIFLREYH